MRLGARGEFAGDGAEDDAAEEARDVFEDGKFEVEDVWGVLEIGGEALSPFGGWRAGFPAEADDQDADLASEGCGEVDGLSDEGGALKVGDAVRWRLRGSARGRAGKEQEKRDEATQGRAGEGGLGVVRRAHGGVMRGTVGRARRGAGQAWVGLKGRRGYLGLTAATAGPEEAAGAEVGEERGYGEGQEEVEVVGRVGWCGAPGGAKTPGAQGGRGGKEAEEDAGELEPEDTGEAAERTGEGLGEAAGAWSG